MGKLSRRRKCRGGKRRPSRGKRTDVRKQRATQVAIPWWPSCTFLITIMVLLTCIHCVMADDDGGDEESSGASSATPLAAAGAAALAGLAAGNNNDDDMEYEIVASNSKSDSVSYSTHTSH